MNYYKRHLGDYARKTAHLSLLEHGVYTVLLDAYYDRERSLSEQEAIRFSRARSEEELRAVKTVLSEFFIEENGMFSQSHADEDISEFHKRQKVNRKLGAIGGKRNAKRIASENEANIEANEKPSHKPLSIIKAPPIVPQGGQEPSVGSEKPKRKKLDRQTFKAWAESLPEGEKAIPEDHRVFRYAGEIGLPDDFVALAWIAFKRSFWESKKTQADWRKHFFNAVQGNWGKLWFAREDGGYGLTTAGIQLQRSVSGGAQ